jgi:hypothetical protein
MTDSGKRGFPGGIGGCAYIMPGPLTKDGELLQVYIAARAEGVDRAEGVKLAIRCQVSDLLQGDHSKIIGVYGL